MDCMMPGLDGYGATEAIRAEEARQTAAGQPKRRLPIVAMTANAMRGDREECLAAGMDDYLSKPLEPTSVLRMVRKWVREGGGDAADGGTRSTRAQFATSGPPASGPGTS